MSHRCVSVRTSLTIGRRVSARRTGCANERLSESVRWAPGRLVSLPRSTVRISVEHGWQFAISTVLKGEVDLPRQHARAVIEVESRLAQRNPPHLFLRWLLQCRQLHHKRRTICKRGAAWEDVLITIEYGKELTDVHVEAGLLTYFSHGGAAWCIAHVDPPARHGPAPVLYIAHKQNLVRRLAQQSSE